MTKKVASTLKGKKTYIAAFGMFLFAVLGVVFNYIEAEKAGEIILEAMALAGLRNAVK